MKENFTSLKINNVCTLNEIKNIIMEHIWTIIPHAVSNAGQVYYRCIFSNMSSHSINKYEVDARKVIAITTRGIRNKISCQLHATDTEKFLKSSVRE